MTVTPGGREMNLVPQLKAFAKSSLKRLFGTVGLDVRLRGHDWSDTRNFIPFEQTLADAHRVGLSVGDYLDAQYNQPGATREAVDELERLGVFKDVRSVVEIGPGSGRYLAETLKRCQPTRYEIYETANKWADWLVSTYGVTLQPTDGRTLAHTPDGSACLAMAHKVMNTIPTLTAVGYLAEMARVVRRGGRVVFDAMTEPCFQEDTIARWLQAKIENGSYPALLPREFLVSFMAARSLALSASYFVPMLPGRTECLVFVKH
jgi:SAM-dependent methyltransferase